MLPVQEYDYEHGFPLSRSLRASTQRSTSVLFSFVLSLLIVAGSSVVRQSKTFSLSHCRVESKRGRIRRVKYWQTALSILAALSASLALADDFKTISGKEYKNATVSRVEPDGLVLRTKSGILKIYFTELPKQVQERFHYDAQKAAQFTSQTLEENRLAREQKVEADKKQAEEIAKNVERVRQQQKAEKQQHEAEMQRQRLEAERQRQVQTNTQPTYSRSQEGIPEHTYELTQDYKIDFGGVTIRFRRGEQYHGRILVDHAEIDRDGRSYNVPSGIMRKID